MRRVGLLQAITLAAMLGGVALPPSRREEPDLDPLPPPPLRGRTATLVVADEASTWRPLPDDVEVGVDLAHPDPPAPLVAAEAKRARKGARRLRERGSR